MYEQIGVLFGCCLRTGVRFPLDLPAFVWKPLVHDPLTLADLHAIDQATAQTLRAVTACDDETRFEAQFGGSEELRFTCVLSDKRLVELKAGGRHTRVTFASRHEYVRLVWAARTTEQRAQIEAVRRGLAAVVPIQLLTLLTWQDLEMAISGKPTIDIDLLR
jgi:hypothetical protein